MIVVKTGSVLAWFKAGTYPVKRTGMSQPTRVVHKPNLPNAYSVWGKIDFTKIISGSLKKYSISEGWKD